MPSHRAYVDLAPAAMARGAISVPGSKSISIRALLLASLAEGRTTLSGVLRADDTTVMIDALRALGVPLVEVDDRIVIDGAPRFPVRDGTIFVGNSGLSIRTLAAALAFSGGRYRLEGVPRMHERPIGDLVDALVAIGAGIGYADRAGYPPLLIEPVDGPRSRRLSVRGDTSSQFVTGLLQAAPALAADGDVTIEVDGPLISRPYVDLTIAAMADFGVKVVAAGDRFVVARGARYRSPGELEVEGDASSASYPLAAGLVGGGPVRVDGLGRSSRQGDARFVDVLVAMGAQVTQDEASTTVESSDRRLRAIDADFNSIPDAAMTVAVLALFADGPSTLRNIGSWRVKETDRLDAMATELAKFGAGVEVGADWLRVEPPAERAGPPVTIATYDDHRMAMCFSLARFLGREVRIEDPGCVAKTWPDYFERFEALVT